MPVPGSKFYHCPNCGRVEFIGAPYVDAAGKVTPLRVEGCVEMVCKRCGTAFVIGQTPHDRFREPKRRGVTLQAVVTDNPDDFRGVMARRRASQ